MVLSSSVLPSAALRRRPRSSIKSGSDPCPPGGLRDKSGAYRLDGQIDLASLEVMEALGKGKVRFAIDLAVRPRDLIILVASVTLIMSVTELYIRSGAILQALAALGSSAYAAAAATELSAELLGVGLAGFLAQLVDGALGMGYGVTSSTVLVAAGLSPALASASVHLAQLGTTLASGVAHSRFGNVDWPVVRSLGAAGACGAFGGALCLAAIPPSSAKAFASSILFALGGYIFARFFRGVGGAARQGERPLRRLLLPLGLVGGFVDATGGGGWGPVATSGLLADGRLPPSRAIGSVSASEFLVTAAAVAGFCAAHGGIAAAGVRLSLVATLLLGGVLAAPIAPLLVTRLHPNLLGTAIGGFICLTNARGLARAYGLPSRSLHAALLLVWLGGVAVVARRREPPPQ